MIMTDLKPGVRYYYKVGNDKYGFSHVFNFYTEPVYEENKTPVRIAVYGDMGCNDESDATITRLQALVGKYICVLVLMVVMILILLFTMVILAMLMVTNIDGICL